MNTLDATLLLRLQERRKARLYRTRRQIDSPQTPQLQVEGQSLLGFCSNDYLGLAADPRVVEAFVAGLKQYGAGSGASHLVSGHLAPHEALEEALAVFTGRSRALVYSSGYMANVGVLSCLLGKQDQVFEDRLNHASLLDGGLWSGARFRRYAHLDMPALQSQLLNSAGEGLRLVVSDGVFSMDGDVAPLGELISLSQTHACQLMIDDAHGFGCLGRNGGGLAALLQEQGETVNQDNLPVLVGTLGKAFGTAGAFVVGSDALIETLIQYSRPYIYTTAMPPAVAVATLRSLELLQTEHWRREHLQTLIRHFRQEALRLGLQLTDSATPIQGILLGTAATALQASQYLEARGLLVTAIRPPTVPEGTSRLRVTFSASHTLDHVDQLLEALAALLPAMRSSDAEQGQANG